MYEYRVLIRGLGKLHEGFESDDEIGIKDKKMLEMGINKLAAKSFNHQAAVYYLVHVGTLHDVYAQCCS